MPLNPFTGEFEGYDSPSTQAGMGMAALSASGVEAPLAFRMLENAPGITASIGFSSMRGSNTIMRGGYSRKNYLTKTPNNFIGTSARRSRAAGAGKTPFVRRALQNNLPRLGNLTRYSDLSIFGASSRGLYTPFAASTMLGRSSRISSALGVQGVGNAFGPGLLSFISAGTKVDRLEKRALAGSQRAMRKLGTVDRNIQTLTNMNNPGFFTQNIRYAGTGIKYDEAAKLSLKARGGLGVQEYVNANKVRVVQMGSAYNEAAAGRVMYGSKGVINKNPGQVGVRGNMMASTMAGVGTQKIAGYFRGAMGYGNSIGYLGLDGAAKAGARSAEAQFVRAYRAAGLGKSSAALKALAPGQLMSSVGFGGMRQIATSGGAKVLAARGIGLAIPGLQVLAAASFMYDLGKMGGEIVKNTINLAKDSVKSLQGSIHKPLFGMGYQDTEAAATSRARGVMAIQNSRLNARSVLGSEAGMMAAHFG